MEAMIPPKTKLPAGRTISDDTSTTTTENSAKKKPGRGRQSHKASPSAIEHQLKSSILMRVIHAPRSVVENCTFKHPIF